MFNSQTPTNVRILLIVLVATSVTSVLYLTKNSFSNSEPNATTREAAMQSQLVYSSDVDQDGLTDIEESYWNTDFQKKDTDGDGYLDGEEVASAHDPLVAGPKDSLKDINFTEKFGELTLSGLYEGSLKPKSPDFVKSIDTLTKSITEDLHKTTYVKIDEEKISTNTPSKEAQEAYVEMMATLFQDFLNDFVPLLPQAMKFNPDLPSEEDKATLASFKKSQVALDGIVDRAYRIEVPENWVLNHRNALQIFLSARNGTNALALVDTDPLRFYTGLESVATTTDGLPKVVRSFANQIVNENLSSGKLFRNLLTPQ